jgi:hypothetical protein
MRQITPGQEQPRPRGRLGERHEVDGREAGGDRAVGEGQDQDSVDEGERQRRLAEQAA